MELSLIRLKRGIFNSCYVVMQNNVLLVILTDGLFSESLKLAKGPPIGCIRNLEGG